MTNTDRIKLLLELGEADHSKDWPDYLQYGFVETDVPALLDLIADETFDNVLMDMGIKANFLIKAISTATAERSELACLVQLQHAQTGQYRARYPRADKTRLFPLREHDNLLTCEL